jgi:dimethylargininase
VIAITREVSPAFARCELTHLSRTAIDVDLARRQHRAYEAALVDAGCTVDRLPSDADMPDSVFVEDIAVVFDELAVITRPGAASRRGEVAAVAEAVGRYRRIETIQPPGLVDGGDVLVAGRRVFVGRSTRTNADAIAQLRRILAPHGYIVCEVTVRQCLHLKSAVTAVGDAALLANRGWFDTTAFSGFEWVDVDEAEPAAANALRLVDRVIVPAAFPRTAARLESRGFRVQRVDASELAKAEGAVTCCSLIVSLD